MAASTRGVRSHQVAKIQGTITSDMTAMVTRMRRAIGIMKLVEVSCCLVNACLGLAGSCGIAVGEVSGVDSKSCVADFKPFSMNIECFRYPS